MTPILSPESFRERFALATFSDGGIVVDLRTGGYLRLNLSAAVYLTALREAQSFEVAAERAATELGVPRTTAVRDLRDVAVGLLQGNLRQAPIGPFTYRSLDDGSCELWERDQPAVRVDGEGQLRLASPRESLSFRPFDHVSEIVPKLLFSQGVTVLHGSSCRRGDALLGMCGKSRAGKTTTARTFARHGSPLVTEDLLIFNDDLDRPAVFVDAETRVRAWSLEASQVLDADPNATVDTKVLANVALGPSIPIEAIWFLDADRRGDRFELKPLPPPDTLGRLMANGFIGRADAKSWRRYLASLHAIVAATEGCEAYLPDGLQRLEIAIDNYTTNSAS